MRQRQSPLRCCCSLLFVTEPQAGFSKELSAFGLFLAAATAALLIGVTVYAFQLLLLLLLRCIWKELPDALVRGGVDVESLSWAFPPLVGALLGAAVGFISRHLVPQAAPRNLAMWVKALHVDPAGCARAGFDGSWRSRLTGGYVLGFLILVLLTVLSGASLGPEVLVIVAPSVLMGSLACGPLQQPPRTARVLALAASAAGLSAFFGLPTAAAFAILELPHSHGLQFYEALPACMGASVLGAIFGGPIFKPGKLLGFSVFLFPGGGASTNTSFASATDPDIQPLGVGAAFFAAAVGLAGGLAGHIFVACIKVLHRFFAWLRGPPGGGLRGDARRAAVVGTVGALNGLAGVFFPAALFWGQNELQYALTRGCRQWTDGVSMASCVPYTLPYLRFEPTPCFGPAYP
jgi:H+/Cl- antiporter ClcA